MDFAEISFSGLRSFSLFVICSIYIYIYIEREREHMTNNEKERNPEKLISAKSIRFGKMSRIKSYSLSFKL